MTTPDAQDLSDIHRGDWVDRRLPMALRPFIRLARLDRPVGIWLALFPCLAALIQAAGTFPAAGDIAVFSLGAFLMRSAGSTINDIADRNFDAHVERTRFRPLACGQTDTGKATAFLIAQLLMSALLLFFLTPFARLIALGVLPLVFLYPFCKRFMYCPQAVLGAAFNWGMIVAWAQTKGAVPAPALVMWAGAVAWQIGYDTVYAYVDVRDDKSLGLKSTAILFGRHGRLCIALLYIFAVTAWSLGGWWAGMSAGYAAGMTVIAINLAWQIRKIDLQRPQLNFRIFLSNILTGFMLMISVLAGTLHI